MKTRIGAIVIIVLVFFLGCFTAHADEPAIRNISIDAALSENGDAQITERWDVTVTGGTEWYLSFNNLGNMTIENLSMTDETGQHYANVGSWDTERSLEEKAGQCGIIDKGGSSYEICWGVASYGDHQYTLSYTLTGLVKRYDDYEGFNHIFITKGLSAPVDHADVTIRYPGRSLNDTTAGIWAFGYEGDIHFDSDIIRAENSKRISTNEGMTIMVQFEPGMFTGAPSASGSFEAVKQRALENSDYKEDELTTSQIILIVVGFAIFLLLIVLVVVFLWLKHTLPDVYYRESHGQSRKDIRTEMTIHKTMPRDHEIFTTFGVLNLVATKPSAVSLFNFYMLKWSKEKAISVSVENDGKKTKTTTTMLYASHGQCEAERTLYQMLVKTSDNGVLTGKAIQKWSYKEYAEIDRWYKDFEQASMETMRHKGLVKSVDLRRSFVSGTVEVLNEAGWQCAKDLLAFGNYLSGLYTGNMDDAVGQELWDDYLVYADLLNIYDLAETWYENHSVGTNYYLYFCMSRSLRASYESGMASRSGGGGGGSSSGGGGGASGGGGGGSR